MGQLQDSLVVSACRSWKPAAAGHTGQHSRSLDHTRPSHAPPGTPQPCLGPALHPGLRGSVGSLLPSQLQKDQLLEEFVV